MKSKTLYINYQSRINKLITEKRTSFLVGMLVVAFAFGIVTISVIKNASVLTSVAQSNLQKGMVLSTQTQKNKEKGDITPKAAAVKNNTYVVQEGETLSTIAQKIYGNMDMWTELVKLNTIANPDVVPAGTVLIIKK